MLLCKINNQINISQWLHIIKRSASSVWPIDGTQLRTTTRGQNWLVHNGKDFGLKPHHWIVYFHIPYTCWREYYSSADMLPTFPPLCEGVYRIISLMSSSLLLRQCPACLVGLTLIVFMMAVQLHFLGACFSRLGRVRAKKRQMNRLNSYWRIPMK